MTFLHLNFGRDINELLQTNISRFGAKLRILKALKAVSSKLLKNITTLHLP
jgi:hypothetical protein